MQVVRTTVSCAEQQPKTCAAALWQVPFVLPSVLWLLMRQWHAADDCTAPDGAPGEGVITYMRTDGMQLSADSVEAARAFIRERYGEDYVPPQPRVYKCVLCRVCRGMGACQETQLCAVWSRTAPRKRDGV